VQRLSCTQIGFGALVATSTANRVAVLRTVPATFRSAHGRMLLRQTLKPSADIVQLIDFVQDRFKRHADTALMERKPKVWDNFRWTGLAQKT
jgi:hypothetical protein